MIDQRMSFAFFTWTWAIAILFHLLQLPSYPHPNFLTWSTVLLYASCIAVLYKPGNLQLFLAVSLLTLANSFSTLLFDRHHHWAMEVFLSACFVAAYVSEAIRSKDIRVDPVVYYTSIAPAGRGFLICMYFWGAFHKLNTAWFDPSTSYAVILWKHFFISLPSWATDSVWMQYCAIYGTLLIESSLMIGLMLGGKWLKPSVIAGVLFHGMIGMNAWTLYWAFSSLAFSLHFLFIPVGMFKKFVASPLYTYLSCPRKYRIFAHITIATVIASTYMVSIHLYAPVFLLWFYIVVFSIWFVWSFAPKYIPSANPPERKRPKKHLLATLTVALFFINGTLPYWGIATRGSIIMFSNLKNGIGRHNHLIIPAPVKSRRHALPHQS